MSSYSGGAPVSGNIGRIPSVKQFDAMLFAAVLAVTATGYYFLYLVRQTFSATASFNDANLNRQLISIGIGIVAALFLSSVDYRYYKLPSYIGYIGSVIILLITAIFGAGGETTGNRNWITLLGVNFQPSEFVKITFIVVSSSFFEKIAEKRAAKLDYIKLLFYAALPIALIQIQRDTGTALVFIFVFAVMVYVSGLKYRYIFALLGAFIVALPVMWFNVISDVQKMRVISFLNPELDKSNTGYQPSLARAAISAGELFGSQTADLAQARFAAVPERQTDFIFTVIAERAGFIGCVALILLYLFILLRCLYIASKAQDRYGEFMVAGLTAMIMFHFIENIGMCVGLMPVTGIPLPFVSYGGTAMIANYIAIGIILSVSVTRDAPVTREL
jgi:rod shape determining protein RodA